MSLPEMKPGAPNQKPALVADCTMTADPDPCPAHTYTTGGSEVGEPGADGQGVRATGGGSDRGVASKSSETLFDTYRSQRPRASDAIGRSVFDDRGAGATCEELAPSADLPTRDPKRYEITGEHARGGLGRILRARDRELGRAVAVKELLEGGHTAQARFVREAMITARLEHPAIVPVHEAGRWPSGEPFYAMKMVSGRSLGEVIKETETLQERLALLPNLIAVADAIAYAHSEQVIHRDLKPPNVMIGAYGETVVIDWGLAKDLLRPGKAAERAAGPDRTTSEHGLTVVGAVIGTPAYMPPEQAQGLPVDERADIYALGAILYHILAGEAPYVAGDSKEVLSAVLAGPPVPIDERVRGLPVDLVAIVNKAMARESHDRYRSAKEFVEDLRRFQTGRLVEAHQYSRRQLILRWVTRHRRAVLVATLALLVVATAGVVSVRSVVAERDLAEAAMRRASERADELAHERDLIDRLATSPTGELVAVLGADGELLRAVVLTGDEWWHQPLSVVSPMLFGGNRLMLAGRDGRFWLLTLDRKSQCYPIAESESLVDAHISAGGRFVAAAAQSGGITVWETNDRAPSDDHVAIPPTNMKMP